MKIKVIPAVVGAIGTIKKGITLTLEPAESSCSSQSNPEKKITGHHVKQHLKEAVSNGLVEKVVDQKWHGRLLSSRWSDDQLSKRGCFA